MPGGGKNYGILIQCGGHLVQQTGGNIVPPTASSSSTRRNSISDGNIEKLPTEGTD